MDLATRLADMKPRMVDYLALEGDLIADAPPHLTAVKVGVVSTYTIETIRPYLVVEGARRDLFVQPRFGPYGQLEQQLFSPTSQVPSGDFDIIVVAPRLEDLAPELAWDLPLLTSEDVERVLDAMDLRVRGLIEGIRERSEASVLFFNCAEPRIQPMGLATTMSTQPIATVVQRVNAIIAEACRATSSAFVFDYHRLVLESGLATWADPKLESLGRIPLGLKAQMQLGARLARYISALMFPPRKCLVVDLDNTLWGGVIGEDGLGGIKLGEDYPGNIFKDFQRQLKALRARGVILAIASKNNEADVRDVFNRHPDMALSWDDFAAARINWTDKASNLLSIAQELNISTDALAFFDDSPREREWVHTAMPEVAVIDVPPNPEMYTQALDDAETFDSLNLVDEDFARAEMYQTERRRLDFREVQPDLGSFLRDLQIHVVIGTVNREMMPRVVQLLGKTNQFNLTTRRYTASELERMVSEGAIALWIRSQDRFGDDGLVGVAIAVEDPGAQWRIDTFLMSCRVIGRGIESILLTTLGEQVAARGGKRLMGEFVRSSKNALVENFYREQGYSPEDGGGQHWATQLDGARPQGIDHIAVEFTEHDEFTRAKG